MSEHNDKYEELISRYIDGELNPGELAELDQALENSAELREVLADLARLKNEIKLETPAPSPDLQRRMMETVQARYGANNPGTSSSSWQTKIRDLLSALPNCRHAGATVATVLFFSIIYVGVIDPQDETDNLTAKKDGNNSVEFALYQVQVARQHYLQAIGDLENLADARLEQLPDEIASVYEANLKIIDQAIKECEETIAANATYSIAYAGLNNAYLAKIDLLTQIIYS